MASEKLKIGFVFDDSLDTTDGVAQYVKALGGWLSQAGHSVTYLVGQSKTKQWQGGRVYSLSKNLRVRWAGNRLSISLIPKIKLMNQVLKAADLDVVHVMVPYSPFMAEPLIRKLKPHTALVGTVHIFPASFLSSVGSRLLRILYGRTLKRFDAMFSVSLAAQAYAKASLKVDSDVLPNVVQVDKFRSSSAKKATKPTIVFLGRLVPRKGAFELLQAYESLKKEVPEARLIIGGNGPLKAKLQKYVDQNKVADVEFAGFVPEEDKPAFLAQGWVACFPSMFGESFGIVLIEAMAAGSGVVIGGDNPGYRSVLGFCPDTLFNPKDKLHFAKLLQKYLADKQAAMNVHRLQQQQVAQYDVGVVGRELIKRYDQAIAKRSAFRA